MPPFLTFWALPFYSEFTVVVILDIFARIIIILLEAVSFAMLIRMLLPLFGGSEESRLSLFLACITEPFIIPVRFFMVKFNILQDSPIDWSFTVTYILIALVQLFLPIA